MLVHGLIPIADSGDETLRVPGLRAAPGVCLLLADQFN